MGRVSKYLFPLLKNRAYPQEYSLRRGLKLKKRLLTYPTTGGTKACYGKEIK